MAETAAPATSNPRASRSRSTTSKATPAKAAPAKTAVKAAEAPSSGRIKLELEHASDTANYSRFNVPESYKGTVVGSVYAPLGTARVGVVVIPADDTSEV